jgi:Flp pilus assembly protein TadD
MAFQRRLACIVAFAALVLTAACAGPVPVSERERTSLAADTYVSDAAQDSALAKDAAPARNPKLAGVLVRVAGVAESSGDYATAARLYRRAHTLDPDRPDVALSLGRALLATHDYSGAAEAFRVVLASDGGNEEALRGLGVSLFTTGRYDEALPALRSAASRRGDSRVLRDLAISYDINGKPKDAQAAYRRAMEGNPNDPTLRGHLALSHALNGEGGMVAPLLDPVANNPNLTSHDRRVMAAAYELSGDTHKARQLLRQNYNAEDTDRAFADFENARTLARENPGLAYALIFDPERSAEDAKTEVARLRQSPERTNVAENRGFAGGLRAAEPVPAEWDQDAAPAGHSQDQAGFDDPSRSPDYGSTPVQLADASGAATSDRHGRQSSRRAGSGYHVQLGAYRTETRAEKGWNQLQRRAPEELGAVGHIVIADPRADGRPPLYQLRTTAYSDRRQAAELCQQLKAKSMDCFVVAARGAPVADSELMASAADGDRNTPDTSPEPDSRRGSSSRGPTQVADASPTSREAVIGGKDYQYQVQLAAYRSLERAERGWRILNRSAPEVLGNVTHIVVTPEQLPEATPLYRLRTREYVERPPADSVCSDLRSRNLDCLVVATTLRTGSNLVAEAPGPVQTPRVTKKSRKSNKKRETPATASPPDVPPADTTAPVAAVDESASAPVETAPAQTAAAAPNEPSEPEPPPAAEPSPAADDGTGHDHGQTGYSVQLAAYKTERLAEAAWKRIQKQAPDLLGKLRPVIAPPDGSAGGNLYRLRAATFEERAVADALCYELKARKLDCLVVRSSIAGQDLANAHGSKDPVDPQTSETIDLQVPPRP